MIEFDLIPINLGGKKALEELKLFIKSENPDIEIKEFKPVSGQFYDCSLSVHIILGDIGSIIAIAGILWKAYQLLKKKSKVDSQSPRLMINTFDIKNKFVFTIDDKINTQDELINKLKEEIKKVSLKQRQ